MTYCGVQIYSNCWRWQYFAAEQPLPTQPVRHLLQSFHQKFCPSYPPTTKLGKMLFSAGPLVFGLCGQHAFETSTCLTVLPQYVQNIDIFVYPAWAAKPLVSILSWNFQWPIFLSAHPRLIYPLAIVSSGPQSRQSAKLFLQSSELGLPQPLSRRRLCPPFDSAGEAHSLAREGAGKSQFRRGDIHCGTL